MCVDRAGVVGQDGETHQGIFDLSFFSIIPNLTVMAPKDFNELEKMIEFAVKLKKPCVIRYPRGSEEKVELLKEESIKLGKSEIMQEGKDITIIAIGRMASRAIQVAKILEERGKSVEVINARFAKPLDDENILKSAKKTKNVFTIEDNILSGGFGSYIEDLLIKNNIDGIKFKSFGWDNKFIEHGKISELEKIHKLDTESIVTEILQTNNN